MSREIEKQIFKNRINLLIFLSITLLFAGCQNVTEDAKKIAWAIGLKDNPDPRARYQYAISLGRYRYKKAINPLIKVMESNDISYIRENAALSLGLIGDIKASKSLKKALDSNDELLSLYAAEALLRLGEKDRIPLIIKQAKNQENTFCRQEAASMLSFISYHFPQEELVTDLNELLTDGNADIQEDVCIALGCMKNSTSVGCLLKALEDENYPCRPGAAWALGEIGDMRAIPALINILNDDNEQLVKETILALGKLKTSQAVSPLTDKLRDTRYQIQIVKALSEIGDKKSFNTLKILLEKAPGDDTRECAARYIYLFTSKDSISPLQFSMKSGNIPIRIACVQSIGKLGFDTSVGVLEKTMKYDSEASVRYDAAYALGLIGGERAKKILKEQKSDDLLNIWCKAGLIVCGEKDMVKEFLKFMESTNPDVRLQTVLAIKKLKLKDGKDLLLKALNDESCSVREASLYALVEVDARDATSDIITSLSSLSPDDEKINEKIFFASDYALRILGKEKYLESRHSGKELLLFGK